MPDYSSMIYKYRNLSKIGLIIKGIALYYILSYGKWGTVNTGKNRQQRKENSKILRVEMW
jgi:hypothetical protein